MSSAPVLALVSELALEPVPVLELALMPPCCLKTTKTGYSIYCLAFVEQLDELLPLLVLPLPDVQLLLGGLLPLYVPPLDELLLPHDDGLPLLPDAALRFQPRLPVLERLMSLQFLEGQRSLIRT